MILSIPLRVRSSPPEGILDPNLPPCPVCGAPAYRGYSFRLQTEISHNCDCAYQHWDRYSRALRQSHRKYWAPRYLAEDLNPYPLYSTYLERKLLAYPGFEEVVSALTQYSGVGTLFLHGPAGSGKTFLAIRLARRLTRDGRYVRFLAANDWARRLREGVSREGSPVLPYPCETLLLDDLSRIYLSPFIVEHLAGLIEESYTQATGLIITSNLDPEALAPRLGDAGEAVSSRLKAGLVLRLAPGADLRHTETPAFKPEEEQRLSPIHDNI